LLLSNPSFYELFCVEHQFKAPRYQQLAHARMLFYLALDIVRKARESKPVLFIVANLCHFAKRRRRRWPISNINNGFSWKYVTKIRQISKRQKIKKNQIFTLGSRR
jgi:hypothetical protein